MATPETAAPLADRPGHLPAHLCRPRRRRRRSAGLKLPLLVLTAAVLSGPSASADMATYFGLTPRSMSLGGAYTGVSDDLAALYYNPAGLVQLPGISVSTGVLMGTPSLSEDGEQLPMADETSFYLHVGVPLSGALKDYLALGVALNMPMGKQLHGTLYKKDVPYFVAHDAAVQFMQFRAGLALRIPWKPLSFLTLGAAIQVLGSVSGAVTMYVPLQPTTDGSASDPDSRMEAWIELDVPTSVFYTLGAMAALGPNLRLGLAYRSEQTIEMVLPVSITARMGSGPGSITVPVDGLARFNPKFYPQQIALGASYQWGSLLLSADLAWVEYSSYIIPYARVSLDLEKLKRDKSIIGQLGANSVILAPYQPELEWVDILVPRVGGEYQALPWLALRLGYFFERSPLVSTDIPVYDCDKHVFSLGARASFMRPLDLIPGRLNIDVGLEEIWYVPREVIGSEVGGHVFAFSAGVEVIFL